MVSKAADRSNSVRTVTLPLSMLHYYIIVNFEKGCFGRMKTFISRFTLGGIPAVFRPYLCGAVLYHRHVAFTLGGKTVGVMQMSNRLFTGNRIFCVPLLFLILQSDDDNKEG